MIIDVNLILISSNSIQIIKNVFPIFWQDYQWIEYYAGKAACTYAMRRAGYSAARFDKLYFDPQCQRRRRNNFYDLNTPCGFAFLGFWIMQSQTLVSLTNCFTCPISYPTTFPDPSSKILCFERPQVGSGIHPEGADGWFAHLVRD